MAKENFANKGAVVMGRAMFDLGEVPWGDDPPYHNPVIRGHLPTQGGGGQAGRDVLHVRAGPRRGHGAGPGGGGGS